MNATRRSTWIAATALAVGILVLAGRGVTQGSPVLVLGNEIDGARAQREMMAAGRDGEMARKRAEILEAKARAVTAQADRTAHDAAAIAARIQETEARIATQQARIRLIVSQRKEMRDRLAARQAPLIKLTGALQRLTRRPPALALLRPGSLREAVYMRALLETIMPQVERRTASLRAEIERGRELERQAVAARHDLAVARVEMRRRQTQLAALESRQRLASRESVGLAARESERALFLAEKARDLGDLVGQVSEQGVLRERLAVLPGPVMRPLRPEEARAAAAAPFDARPPGLADYALPVTGRLVKGFGEVAPGEAAARGLELVTRPHALVVAPTAGRVAYAGPYRGYGRIVILEHDGGWTSLVTGLVRDDVSVGDEVVAGSPLGSTGPGEPHVLVELRRRGIPVNPLQYLHSL